MNPENAFFTEDFELTLSHPISGTQCRYTLNGSEPDSLNAMLYSEPMKISENTLVKVKAYKKGWMGSPTVQTYFYKTGFHPDSSRLETPPDPSYKARGAFSLFDLDDGSSDIRDGKWIGYRGRPLEAVLQFKKPIMLSNVSLSTFINTRAHLYPPFSIEVWGGGPGEEATLLTKKSVDPPKEHQPASKQIYDCPLEGRQVTHLRIVVTPLENLPAWPDPNDNHAWILVDEIVVTSHYWPK